MADLRRQYAHFHRVLLELLLDLEQQAWVWWLTDKQGHLPKPEGEANTYRKALYVLEDLEPYRVRLADLETVRQTVLGLAIAKPVGVLAPVAVENLNEVVLSKTVSWSSHAYDKSKVITKLYGALELAKRNLKVFDTFASADDPRREAIVREIYELEQGIETVRTYLEATLRERAKSEKHTARLYPEGARAEATMLYIRDVGLIVAGAGLIGGERVRYSKSEHRRSDKMQGRLEPLLTYGNYAFYSEKSWQQVKASSGS